MSSVDYILRWGNTIQDKILKPRTDRLEMHIHRYTYIHKDIQGVR